MENENNEMLAQHSDDIKKLYVNFLVLLEDLKDDHDRTFYKLSREFPEMTKTLTVCDYFDDEKLDHLRKRVLDMGNGCVRSVKISFSKKY